MSGNGILAVLVFLPMIGGGLAWRLRGADQKAPNYNAGNHKSAAFPVGSALAADITAVVEFLLMLLLFVSCVGKVGEGAALSFVVPEICGFGLSFTLDGFRMVYCLIAGLMWMMTALLCPEYFAGHHNTARFYVFFLLTLGATMGVFLSADLYTTFIFFEMMSFTSYVWVAHEENNGALRAADTYLAVAVLGGLVMLMGVFGVWHELGTLTISELPAAAAAYENKKVLYALGCCM
ncbi:MAG: sodium:proton antiporter, partial [Clostridiales bacterium]|nr:sodium:proton antiporter [Clostridiales bacterium]